MTSDNEKVEAAPSPKSETAKDKSASGEAVSKTKGSEASNYSRGEGQKPVSSAYKENWNTIFGKKTAKKT
ncbi:MAG: hypothetical protein WBD33_13405 [Xanthobacteraceae bacterium]|jgi:hypothetical protein